MSREIKFKCWLAGTNTMTRAETIGGLIDKTCHDKGVLYLQYTGLKDRNGTEIYEGDIILTPMGNVIEIFFGEKEYRFGKDIIQCNGWLAKKIGSKKVETLDDSMTDGKVIGSIYETPDLLNQ